MKYAIFVKLPDGKGTIAPLPERYDTPAQAKRAWGYFVMRPDVRPEYIETVTDNK